MADNTKAPPPSAAGASTSTGGSKYTFGAKSQAARLQKEATQIRTRVQQLLEAVAKQQQKKKQKSQQQESPAKSPPVANSAAALFVRKNANMAALFGSSSATATSCASQLNARHLRMGRQLLTVSFVVP